MQTEYQYLAEVSQLMDSLRLTDDLHRKQILNTHLYRNVLPKRYQYGFKTVKSVRESLEYMKAGKPDPTKPQRLEGMKRFASSLQKAIGNMEKEMGDKTQQKDVPHPSSFQRPPLFSWEKQPESMKKDHNRFDDRHLPDMDRD